jgi:proline iminopeptidase
VPSIRANGLDFEYESLGDSRHPVILLVMGLGVQMILWPDELCRMLVEKGFRVVRFDNRDIGLSTKLDHLGVPNIALEAIKFALHMKLKAPYYIEDMAGDTEALLAALGSSARTSSGASMGGMICQNLAVRAPARVASLTSIMSTTGDRRCPRPRARRARRSCCRCRGKATSRARPCA